MLRAVAPLLACAMMAMIVACGQQDPVANDVNNMAGPPVANEAVPSPDGGPPANAVQTAEPAPAVSGAAKIPAALQGRWGLTPADCMTARGDEKGLLIVTGDALKFYESRAVPSADVQSGADTVSGNFAFTGEGQSWTKYQSLQLKDHDLVRTESNPTASFTYAKCR
jgi:hypothetical protein